MTTSNNLQEFIENGYFILENVISKKIIEDTKKIIKEKLIDLGAAATESFSQQYYSVIKTIHPFEVNKQLMRQIVGSGMSLRILQSYNLLENFIHLIGPDLAYETSSELPINIRNEKNDSLVKKFHQEFWTGMGYRTFTCWAPLILEHGAGSLELIKKSHTWGHIPHQNREPLTIPHDAEYITVTCQEGDVLIFHPLTLHRTVPNPIECPRVAFTTQIKNPCEPETGFERLGSWEVFHLSPLSKVMKTCGNPHLSPFRIYGSNRQPIKTVCDLPY